MISSHSHFPSALTQTLTRFPRDSFHQKFILRRPFLSDRRCHQECRQLLETPPTRSRSLMSPSSRCFRSRRGRVSPFAQELTSPLPLLSSRSLVSDRNEANLLRRSPIVLSNRSACVCRINDGVEENNQVRREDPPSVRRVDDARVLLQRVVKLFLEEDPLRLLLAARSPNLGTKVSKERGHLFATFFGSLNMYKQVWIWRGRRRLNLAWRSLSESTALSKEPSSKRDRLQRVGDRNRFNR